MKIPRGQTEERRAYMKAYVASHPKRDRRAYKAAYDEAHKAEIVAYRLANKEKVSARLRKRYTANRESILARVKAYYESNKERVLAYQIEYAAANKEKIRKRQKEYNQANPHIGRNAYLRRRDDKRANGGSHTAEEVTKKFVSLGNVCFYCGSNKKLSIDHDIPVSRGGGDGIENILPACVSCNSKKSNRTAKEYLARLAENNKLPTHQEERGPLAPACQ